ncbi:MAG: PAS domain S-box protein [Deltaproteobacteria bacterium]|nr:PAS domain S-box protein [Deltaproteobacteria bacterium]
MVMALKDILEQIPELWKEMLETMDEALFLVDTERNVVYINRGAEKLTGFDRNELVGKYCLEGIKCPSCLEDCKLFKLGKIHDAELEIKTKSGETRTVRKNAVVLKNYKGAIIGGIETFRDVTALKQEMTKCMTEHRLAEERERTLSTVLGSIQEGVAALDKDWRIVSLSRRAEQILGIREADAINKRCKDVFGSELCDTACPVKELLESGMPSSGRRTNIETKSKNGPTGHGHSVPILESAAPLVDEYGDVRGSLVLLLDLTAEEGMLAGLEKRDSFFGLIGRSMSMQKIFKLIEQLSESEATVLITGESGTGKELVARAIHKSSPRKAGAFVTVNCAAIPENLLESELFGHKKGAFTGAVNDRLGRVAKAEGGTLFLDEIGELPLTLQAKLLRLLQERTYERVGDDETRNASVRIIAATNKDLKEEVQAGRFREDLYYRLRVIPVHLPPLRERQKDIPLLANRLLADRAIRVGRPGVRFSSRALDRLRSYSWPGNVRELINIIEYSLALTRGDRIDEFDLTPDLLEPYRIFQRQRYFANAQMDEKEEIQRALEENSYHRSRTARVLGMDRVTLYRKIKKYGIKIPNNQK